MQPILLCIVGLDTSRDDNANLNCIKFNFVRTWLELFRIVISHANVTRHSTRYRRVLNCALFLMTRSDAEVLADPTQVLWGWVIDWSITHLSKIPRWVIEEFASVYSLNRLQCPDEPRLLTHHNHHFNTTQSPSVVAFTLKKTAVRYYNKGSQSTNSFSLPAHYGNKTEYKW